MKILIINGPNMNMLDKRDKHHYGGFSLKIINQSMKDKYPNIKFRFFQSNHEGEIIDYLQRWSAQFDGVIINPAGLTHTSVVLRDALEICKQIKVEVHLSDISKRESFRSVNLITDVVDKMISGKLDRSYLEAVDFIIEKCKK